MNVYFSLNRNYILKRKRKQKKETMKERKISGRIKEKYEFRKENKKKERK